MDFLNYLRNASFEDKYLTIVLSAIGGITGGALLILYPNAALHIFEEGRYFFFLAVLPPTSCIYLLAKRFSQSQAAKVTEQILEDQILSITNTIRHEELAEFEKRNRADIFMALVNAKTITQGATKSIDVFAHNITLVIGWLYIYFYLAPSLGLIILIWRLIYILFREAFQSIIKSITLQEMAAQKTLFALFENHLFGFKELKFNRRKRDDLFDNHLAPLAEKIKRLRVKARFYASELMLIYIVSLMLLQGTCVFILSASITTETALKALIIMMFMMKTDVIILGSIPYILEGNAALERMRKLFGKTSSLKDKNQNLYVPGKEFFREVRSLSMEGIRYSYPAADSETGFTVEIDDLKIRSGEIFFVVGGNGSGKSTLVNILTGLYRPGAGRIMVNDQTVQMTNHRYLFSTVFADFHLFDRIYGMDAIDDRRVNELLKTMDLLGKTQYRKGRFSSLDLSTGQKKRLALIVALLEDKPVYVFDEWAADQDPGFRRIFYEEILPAFRRQGKTVIAITHDDHYFGVADQVIRMQDGRIVERLRTESEKKTAPRLFMEGKAAGAKESVPSDGKPVTTAKDAPAGTISGKSGRAKIGKGMIAQFRQIFKAQGAPLKKLLFLLIVVCFAMVAAPIVILSSAQLPPGQSRHIPFIQFIILLVLYVMSFRRLNRTFYEAVEERISGFRLHIVDRVRRTTLLVLERVGPGRILTKLTSDIKAIADTSFTILMTILGGVRTLMIYVYVAFLYFPAFVIMTALTCLGGGIYAYNHTRLMRIFEQLRDQERLLFDSVNHLLEGFKELKLNPRKSDDFFQRSLRHHSAELHALKLRTSRYYINNYTIAYAFSEITLLSLTLLMPFFQSAPYVLPVTIALILTMPLNQVIDHYSQFHMAYMSLQHLLRFEEDMQTVYQEEDAGDAGAGASPVFENIRLEDVAFTYRASDGHPFRIGPLTADFEKGEIVFITGGNGSGKSTLLKVITGLYPPDAGRILVNGAETDIPRHQELFAGVFGDFHLFDRLYGMKEMDETRIDHLLRRFHLNAKVTCRGGKFSTLDLSTGQRKRLALVISILEDKPVYVFDEWAADQDPHFREYFYTTLLPEFRTMGKTVIAVTHDDRFFHCADRVIHMEYGQVANR